MTVFDGTGVGLQDLAVAASVVELAIKKGVAIEVEFCSPAACECACDSPSLYGTIKEFEL